MENMVVIDCFPETVELYRDSYAIVAVDVIRATTSAVTAAALGRQCFSVPSVEMARALTGSLENPLLVGELGGVMPRGFEMNNSPAELALRTDIHRPMILLSTSGTKLICEAGNSHAAYLACFRNYASLASYLVNHHSKIAIIGAGSRGQFREEDQMCCAWIAEKLIQAGYQPENHQTRAVVEHWKGKTPDACVNGDSAKYLKRSGQLKDLDFVLEHINDIEEIFTVEDHQISVVTGTKRLRDLDVVTL